MGRPEMSRIRNRSQSGAREPASSLVREHASATHGGMDAITVSMTPQGRVSTRNTCS